MTETAKSFGFRRQTESAQMLERRTMAEGLRQASVQLSQAYQNFNAARDPDLIESAVFEIKAMQARYSYFLRQVKLLERDEEQADGAG